jgi:hypothetical protein
MSNLLRLNSLNQNNRKNNLIKNWYYNYFNENALFYLFQIY